MGREFAREDGVEDGGDLGVFVGVFSLGCNTSDLGEVILIVLVEVGLG